MNNLVERNIIKRNLKYEKVLIERIKQVQINQNIKTLILNKSYILYSICFTIEDILIPQY